jgi:hypothetical protein
VASFASNVAIAKMGNKTTPSKSDCWKKLMITEADCFVYHVTGWLGGGLKFHVPKVDKPTVDGSTMVCFKSHLIAGLGLPPTKFLVAIMNFLGSELVHLNLNAIAALSYFTMLCECWLGIVLNTSLFWYFYSPNCYNKAVYTRIRQPSKGIHRCHLQELPRGVLPEGGSWWICTFPLNG